jgi:glutathione synthase/RimK-type ligase-like ATP-grasp enzyme
MDVLLVTCAAMPGLHDDDRYLLNALRERGVRAEPAVWEDPYREWSTARMCVVRSAWDYSYRRDQFVAWAESVQRVTQLWNSASVVRWNTHKHYLCDLADAGVPVVPTVVLRARSEVVLETELSERGWTDAVLKAAVAQTGRYAMRISAGHVAAGQEHLDRILPHEDMLLQPLLPSVGRRGEISIVFVAGEFTHAVRKLGTADQFMVHHDYGGTVTPGRPSRTELELAHRAIEHVREPLLYARVDVVADERGRPVIMEFELVEPELFFRYSEAAVTRLVAAIERKLKS